MARSSESYCACEGDPVPRVVVVVHNMLTCSSDRPHAIAATTLEHGRRRVLHGPQQRVVLRLLGLELPSHALERRLLRLAEDERLVLFFAGRQVRRVRATAAEALVPLAR